MRRVTGLRGTEQQVEILPSGGIERGSNVAQIEQGGYGAFAYVRAVFGDTSKRHQSVSAQQDAEGTDKAKGNHELARDGKITKCGHGICSILFGEASSRGE